MLAINFSASHSIEPSFVSCCFKPIRWCHHRWEDLTSPIQHNKNVLAESFKRIFLAVHLVLATLAACPFAVLGFLSSRVQKTKPVLEINYLTHEKLLFLLKTLYPDYQEAGLCSGYSLTVINDLLKGSSSYRTTLKKLDSLMGRLIEEDLIREIKKDEDLSNFFNKIYTQFCKQQIDHLIGSVSGTYTHPQDLLSCILSFQEQLNSTLIPFKSLVFLIGSKDHNIVIGFNKEEKVYRLVDANRLNSNIFSLDSLSQEIAISYDLPEKSTAFYIKVCLSPDGISSQREQSFLFREDFTVSLPRAFSEALAGIFSTDIKHTIAFEKVFNAWKKSILDKQIQRLDSLSEKEKANWLYNAAYSNDGQSVSLLINSGVNISQPIKKGFTPLHVACQNGYKDIAKMLINKGTVINQANENGTTPLILACQQGHEEVVKILIDKKADLNQANKDGATPLYMACQNGHTEVIKILIKAGVNIDQTAKNGSTSLHVACQNGHKEAVTQLVKAGGKINPVNESGCTPLYMACQEGHEEIVKLLMDKVNDVNQADKKKCTLLYVASKYGHEKIAQMLIDKKADLNQANESGFTPLHVASQYGHEKIAQMLIDSKCKFNLRNRSGALPLDIARYMKHKKIEQMLLAVQSGVAPIKEDELSTP